MKKITIIVSASSAALRVEDFINKYRSKYDVTVVATDEARMFLSDDFEYITTSYTPNIPIHVNLANDSDIILVMPATYNLIGKYSNGIADDLATSILTMSVFDKVIMCPAMNTKMWYNPTLQRNINYLKEIGVTIVEPIEGSLSNGSVAFGHMAEFDTIDDVIMKKIEI